MSDENWLDSLPESLREAPFIGKAENLDDAIGKLAHAAQYMGQAVKMPGADADGEAIEAFFAKVKDVPGMARLPLPDDAEGYNALMTKLGKPEEHTDYAVPEVDEYQWDEGISEALRKYALEAGLTKNQFDAFARKIGEQEKQTGLDAEQSRQDARKELRLDWGETLEDREALIRGWMDKSEAPENMRQLLDEGNLPLEAMNWMHSIAKQFAGDVTPIQSDGNSVTPPIAPDTARERIQEVLRHPAYFDAADPRHKDLVKQMHELQKLANPEQAA